MIRPAHRIHAGCIEIIRDQLHVAQRRALRDRIDIILRGQHEEAVHMIDLPPPQKACLHIRRIRSLRAAHLHDHLDPGRMQQLYHRAEFIRRRICRAVRALRRKQPPGTESPVINPVIVSLASGCRDHGSFRKRFQRGLGEGRAGNQFPESLRPPSCPGGIRNNLIKFITRHQDECRYTQLFQVWDFLRDAKECAPFFHLRGAALRKSPHMHFVKNGFAVRNAKPLFLFPPVKHAVKKCASDLVFSSGGAFCVLLQA